MIFPKSINLKLLFLILFLAFALRFWRLESLTTFSGDQGYDFLIIRNMFQEHKITLLGPKIGPYNQLGNLYLGPFYYYLLAPALLLFSFDPLGAAVLTAIMAIFTVYLVYLIAKHFFDEEAGLIASAIYALNPFLISQSRAPSNPHFIPFFSALFIYSNLKMTISKSKSNLWPLVCGFCLGAMFQLHYLSSVLIPISALALLVNKQLKKMFFVTLAFLLTVFPQILFELRHEFFISKLFFMQISTGNNLFSVQKLTSHTIQALSLLSKIFFQSNLLEILFFLFIVIITISQFWAKRRNKSIYLLAAIIIVGFISASLYAGNIEPHYFSIIYVPLIIVFGVFTSSLLKQPASRILTLIFLSVLFLGNFLNLDLANTNGYTMPQGWNLVGIKKASRIISSDINSSQKFNIAATLDGDTRAMPTRYLVTVYGKNPQTVENYPSSDVIYLISRDPEEKIKSYGVWEISSFSPFAVKNIWEIQNGVKLYKLTH